LPLFDAQLRFADALAAARGESLQHALETYTNFYRRFGYGIPDRTGPPDGWLAYLDAARAAKDHAARLVETAEHFVRGTWEQPLPGNVVFGCFSYTPPEPDGTVRIHFLDREPAAAPGPLSRVRMPVRRAELARMTASILREHPGAQRIRGRSWLYNLGAYRRLFPPAYVAAPEVVDSGVTFWGSGCWGQFQRHRGIDEAAVAALLARLPALDPEWPWRVMPLGPITVVAPIDVFRGHYLSGEALRGA
jgi:hypothetical protein